MTGGDADVLTAGRNNRAAAANGSHAANETEVEKWPAPENESTLYVTRTGSIWCDRAMLPVHGSTVSGAGGRYPSELWGRTAL